MSLFTVEGGMIRGTNDMGRMEILGDMFSVVVVLSNRNRGGYR